MVQPALRVETGEVPVRVVVADDNADIRMMLRAYLEADGRFTVMGEAADGDEVVRVVAATNPDVIILDLYMPDVGGLEAIPQLRARSRSMKIIVYTAYAAAAIVRAALTLGADAVVRKGVPMAELVDTVDRLYPVGPGVG